MPNAVDLSFLAGPMTWIAHSQEGGEFNEDASEFVRKNGPHKGCRGYKVFPCIAVFVGTVQALLPEIAGPGVGKFNRPRDARSALHVVGPKVTVRNTRTKLERMHRKAVAMRPEIPWGAQLGAARVCLEKLGGDDPCMSSARPCPPKGGSDAQ